MDTQTKKVAKLTFDDLVGIPGLEPGKAGPESAVLPLHHIPMLFYCKIRTFQLNDKEKSIFFLANAFDVICVFVFLDKDT